MVLVLWIAVSGCGVVVGTTDYWDRYNETIRLGRGLEHLGDSDRSQLEGVIRRVGK